MPGSRRCRTVSAPAGKRSRSGGFLGDSRFSRSIGGNILVLEFTGSCFRARFEKRVQFAGAESRPLLHIHLMFQKERQVRGNGEAAGDLSARHDIELVTAHIANLFETHVAQFKGIVGMMHNGQETNGCDIGPRTVEVETDATTYRQSIGTGHDCRCRKRCLRAVLGTNDSGISRGR